MQFNNGLRANRLEAVLDNMGDETMAQGRQTGNRGAEPRAGQNTVELTAGQLDTTQRYLLDQTVVKNDNFTLSNFKDNDAPNHPEDHQMSQQKVEGFRGGANGSGIVVSHSRSR